MPAKRVEPSAGNPLINNQTLKQLYASMLRCRMLAERTSLLSKRNGCADSHAMSIGQEATAAGVVSHLRPEDALAPAPGSLITSFLKGAALDAVFSHLAGPAANRHAALNGNSAATLNLISLPGSINAGVNLATGAALGYKMQKNERVVAVFLPPQPLENWRETLNFAASHHLPIIYVSQRNLTRHVFSTNDSRDDAVADVDLDTWAAGVSLPIIPVDGHDVVAVYRVAQESILRARRGSGPTLIEARGRPAAASNDPIRSMEAYLAGKGLFREAWKQKTVDRFNSELDAAMKAAAKAPPTRHKPLAKAR